MLLASLGHDERDGNGDKLDKSAGKSIQVRMVGSDNKVDFGQEGEKRRSRGGSISSFSSEPCHMLENVR